MSQRFKMGTILMTRGIADAMQDKQFERFVYSCFYRYMNADWGEMCKEDILTNDSALDYGDRILASYDLPANIKVEGEDKVWIITEWDRSATTVLFPSEY